MSAFLKDLLELSRLSLFFRVNLIVVLIGVLQWLQR